MVAILLGLLSVCFGLDPLSKLKDTINLRWHKSGAASPSSFEAMLNNSDPRWVFRHPKVGPLGQFQARCDLQMRLRNIQVSYFFSYCLHTLRRLYLHRVIQARNTLRHGANNSLPVTLFTTLTVSRLPQLLHQCQMWPGPLSAALW
jgi:hypothetical protein